MSAEDPMLRAALSYAGMGFAVFPCALRGKAPLTAHGVKDATKDPEVIRALWSGHPGANVGIATGAISGIAVVDIDPRHGGDDTLETLSAYYGKLPETATVLTGGGGLHFYFRHPGGVVPNSAGKVGQGIDVRCDGGYVIAPRSVHESGNQYLWEVSSRIDDVPLGELPAWLLKLMSGAESESTNGTKSFDPPPIFQDGTRNEYLYRTARSARAKFSLNADELLNLLRGINQSRCKPPVNENELSKISNNAATQPDRADFKPGAAVDPDVERLARLSPLEYAKCRKVEAKQLGVPVGTLDGEVGKARPKSIASSTEALAPAAPEPWPEAVDGFALLDDLHAFIKRFIVVSAASFVALTLWIVFTYLLDVAETSPRLALTSPVKRCGKSRLLGVLSALIYKPIPTSNVSPSAIFRTIDQEQCSLLVDEADAMPRKGSERGEEMRGLLNSGHTREAAFAIRNIKSGDDWIPKKFSTWAAIAVAAIGRLPDTWADRSIAIAMQRKSPRQQVERLIRRNVGARAEAAELARKIARWVADHRSELASAIPDLPKELDDRASDNWESLLAIADLSGGDWPRLARQAAVSLSTGREEGSSVGEELLDDIREIFVGCKVENGDGDKKISSGDLCAALAGMESRPWAEFGRSGKPITPPRLARLLADFGIAPTTIRIGDSTPKGYTLKAFESAFSCYLSANPLSKRNTATTLGAVRESSDFQSATETQCCGTENGASPNGENECGVVADQNRKQSDKEDF
jgi:Bifunctional DNA primase/polymerase, N-terminal/Protein of unknown function (DUF3631)